MARPTRYHQLEDQFAQVIDDLELYSYYQLLEVDGAASADVILYNFNMKIYEYEQLQKDRWCGPVLHRNLELLKRRLDEAREVLCDRKLRVPYDRGLEEGQTRHPEVAARRDRAVRVASRPTGPLTQVEQLSAQLERRIHKDLIHAGEEIIPDEPSMGIDEVLVDQLTIDLKDQVEQLGVDLAVKPEEPEEQARPMDGEYLDQAAQHLVGKLIVEHKLTFHERVEEDQSASAAFASEITDGLRGELYKMGVSEWDAHEADALPPDLETLDRLLAAEQGAVEKLGVKTEVQRDEGLHARDIDRATAGRFAAELEGKLDASGIRHQAAAALAPSTSTRSAEPDDLLIELEQPEGITSRMPSARTDGPSSPQNRPEVLRPLSEEHPVLLVDPLLEVIALDDPPGAPAPEPGLAPPPPMKPPRVAQSTGPHPAVVPAASPSAEAEEDAVPVIPLDDDP